MKTEIICYKIEYNKDCMKYCVCCFFAEIYTNGITHYRMKQISNYYERKGNAFRWARNNNIRVY